MTIIDIYLAHRNSTKFIQQQIDLIKKYFVCNYNSTIQIYGFVDFNNNLIGKDMENIWKKKMEQFQ
jgi:hypothetical protein